MKISSGLGIHVIGIVIMILLIYHSGGLLYGQLHGIRTGDATWLWLLLQSASGTDRLLRLGLLLL